MKPDPLGGRRDPLRAILLVWLVISGIVLFFGVRLSTTIATQLHPELFERVYGGMQAVSAAAALAGMFWPWDPRDGLTAKLAGWCGLGFSALVFSAATILTFSLAGTMTGVTVLIFAVWCFKVAGQVIARMRAARKVTADVEPS